jgi:hydrogenase maturation protease
MDEPPGTIRRFTPDEVDSRKRLAGLSLHEGDLLQTIRLSRRMGECPEEVVIFGIQPSDVSVGTDLSDTLKQRLSDYRDAVSRELSTP